MVFVFVDGGGVDGGGGGAGVVVVVACFLTGTSFLAGTSFAGGGVSGLVSLDFCSFSSEVGLVLVLTGFSFLGFCLSLIGTAFATVAATFFFACVVTFLTLDVIAFFSFFIFFVAFFAAGTNYVDDRFEVMLDIDHVHDH